LGDWREDAERGVQDDLFDSFAGFGVLGAGQVEAGDLEAVEQEAGAAGVDGVGGDAAQDLADRCLDGGTVLGIGQVEGGLLAAAVLYFPFWDGTARIVVIEAKFFLAERWARATVAIGEDMTALKALDGLGYVGLRHGTPTPGVLG